MPAIYYMPVCSQCGKRGGGSCSRTDGPPKSNPPSIPGRCPSSSDGKHKPRWEVDYSRKPY